MGDLVCDLAGAPQELINPHHRNPWRDTQPKPSTASARGRVGVPVRCCLQASTRMRNPGGPTTASATTVPPWVLITPKTHSDSPHDSPRHKGMSTTRHTEWMCPGLLAVDIHDMDAQHLAQKDHYYQMGNLKYQPYK